jgi:hypothetical protein
MEVCEGVGMGENVIYLRACARRRAPRARVSDRARESLRAHDVACWTSAKNTLGRFVDLGDLYWVDVRLVYPVRRPVHLFERAQRCRWRATASNSSADHSASAAATGALVGSHCRMSSRPCLWLCAVRYEMSRALFEMEEGAYCGKLACSLTYCTRL